MIRASNRPKEQLAKRYTTVQVGRGHGFEDVVRENMEPSVYSSVDEYVSEVCEINSLPYAEGRLPELRPGSQIVIPYYTRE